jgi:hypothetical protein
MKLLRESLASTEESDYPAASTQSGSVQRGRKMSGENFGANSEATYPRSSISEKRSIRSGSNEIVGANSEMSYPNSQSIQDSNGNERKYTESFAADDEVFYPSSNAGTSRNRKYSNEAMGELGEAPLPNSSIKDAGEYRRRSSEALGDIGEATYPTPKHIYNGKKGNQNMSPESLSLINETEYPSSSLKHRSSKTRNSSNNSEALSVVDEMAMPSQTTPFKKKGPSQKGILRRRVSHGEPVGEISELSLDTPPYVSTTERKKQIRKQPRTSSTTGHHRESLSEVDEMTLPSISVRL